MKKSEKKKIAVGVCGTVFRSFLIFTVISCLLSMVLYQIFVLCVCHLKKKKNGSPSFSSCLRL